MVGDVVVYVAAGVVAAWGLAHLVPTRAVVSGFAPISIDNARVLTMEWVAEGMTMLFVAALVLAVTLAGGIDDSGAAVVYRVCAGLLAAVAVLTAMTGARTPVVWFKACPFVLAAAVALLLAGSFL